MSRNPEVENIDGVEFYYFCVPMYHEDWHVAEDMGLAYVRYNHHGPDYWDDTMLFVRKADKEKAEKDIRKKQRTVTGMLTHPANMPPLKSLES